MRIAFDQPDSKAKYEIDLYPDEAEAGDGIVLVANREGLLALADVFQQLAASTHPSNHLHLGYTEEQPQGPGFRIVLDPSARITSVR